MKKINVALIGVGYWGKNLLRNLVNCKNINLKAVCDQQYDKTKELVSQYGNIDIYTTIDDILNLDIDGVVIATPVDSHYELTKKTLLAGKHVLIEKPITTNYEQAVEIDNLSKDKNLILMCDHTFCFSSPVRKIKKILAEKTLGDLICINSSRTNLGLFQKDTNVIWDLAPHDFSILDYVLTSEDDGAQFINTRGVKYPNYDHCVDAQISLKMKSGLSINIHNSWIYPEKVRKMVFVGTEKMLVWDDLLNNNQKLKIYNKKVRVENNNFEYVDEGIKIPFVNNKEPLAELVNEFAKCVVEGSCEISDGTKAANIVKMLELSNKSLENNKKMEVI